MTDHYHAVVWVDHHQAIVIHFNPTDVETKTIYLHHKKKNIHSHVLSRDSNQDIEDHNYFHDITESIEKTKAVMITGPSNAKHGLVKHIKHHDQRLYKFIVGVETVDHPSDGQILATARKYFEIYDRNMLQK